MKDFCRQKGAAQGSYTSKELTVCGKVTYLEGMAGVYRADDLPGAYQAIPDGLVLLVGTAETVI